MNNTEVSKLTLLTIGCGNMGGAMFSSALNSGIKGTNTVITVHDDITKNTMQKRYPQSTVYAPEDIELGHLKSHPTDILIYAAKPQQLGEGILTPYSEAGILHDESIIISMAAGTPVRTFSNALRTPRVIRIMPNTPAFIGKGITALFATAGSLTAKQKSLVETLLSHTGNLIWLEDENLMHIVTATSGSGPAYVFHLLECLTTTYPTLEKHELCKQIRNGLTSVPESTNPQQTASTLKNLQDAVTATAANTSSASECCQLLIPEMTAGWIAAAQQNSAPDGDSEVTLPASQAKQCVHDTIIGALALWQNGTDTPTKLRENVTSKGGTTAAGLAVLMNNTKPLHNIAELMMSVLTAAKTRSHELS